MAGLAAGRTVEWAYHADIRYVGQASELLAPVASVEGASVAELADTFHALHKAKFGYDELDAGIEVMNLRVTGFAVVAVPSMPVMKTNSAAAAPKMERTRMPGAETCLFTNRDDLGAGSGLDGPAIITEPTATTFVPPGWRLTMDPGDILICAVRNRSEDRNMYGRLGRIGLLVLDSDLTIEPDLRRILPEGIETHAARVVYPRRVTAENMEIAANGAIAAVEQLLPVRPSVIAWACTSGSFYAGKAGNARLNDRLTDAAGMPATTASSALAAAMAELGIKRPAVGSAYSPAVNERLTAYLRECGMEPAAMRGIHQGELDDYELQDVEEEQVANFAQGLARTDCDAVILSCTGLPTIRIVSELERAIGKPVITSNLALLWHCFKLAGFAARPTLDCRLFRTLNANRIADHASA